MFSSPKLPSAKEASDGNILNDVEDDDVDEEEEDVDFNPFLKDDVDEEASSSLSSDIEVLDDDVTDQVQECTRGGVEFETVLQACEEGKRRITPATEKKRKAVLISPHEMETTSGTDNLDSNVARDPAGSNNYVPGVDLEDAISKRTRARYSLASFTLDELETFLQETDDEDDLHNVDDEEEYRKFLAAVLQGGDNDDEVRQDNENVEDDDEDNDADFELELEEALESDLEENCESDLQEKGVVSRRPETRLDKRKKVSDQQTSKALARGNRPLRPLLPNIPVASFPILIPKCPLNGLSAPLYNCSYGFTPQQLVQLHCLIHEHVQLLVQVFSLCVHDPSRQHIASQVKELISGALQEREQVISWKRAQYPFSRFSSPYGHPSVPLGHTQSSTVPCERNSDSSPSNQREALSGINSQNGIFQTLDSALQMPSVNGPILTVLDVAPLALVGKYMDEVSKAVRERKRQSIESGASAADITKEPLFPFHDSQTLAEGDAGIESESAEVGPSKKSLAAVLVEETKKDSIAFVPKEIAELARRFLPLFNPALFPHKPPRPAVASRILFTDSEDELLALGLMEFNSDWKAIQQRYLPCKSKHQIFVRQKNRSCSSAPDNPIKIVRKMKTSPLTEEEIARIREGLKVFKLDWMSVWRYMVPYRDPSLLPRQWRIAHGTQKAYKISDDKKAKRRMYENNRRNGKSAALASWETSPGKEDCQPDKAGAENNSGEDCMGKEDEAYVHEAFLADWRPATSLPTPSLPFPNHTQGHRPPCGLLSQSDFHVIEQVRNNGQANSNISASATTLRYGRPQLVLQPYTSRRKRNTRLVKLAPDLPPVTLPASVRVMSQSAFKSYKTGKEVVVKSLIKTSNGTQGPGESHVPRPIEHPVESHVPGAKYSTRDKNQSDLQMHPLLFQASGDRNLPYYPLSCGNSNSSSFNFFQHFQPQSNLGLLCNPHMASQEANHFKSSNEFTSSIGIDFHPLLQRSDDVATDSATANSLPPLPANSELFRSSFAQITPPWAGNSFPGSFTKLLNEQSNEVDLDIHLSLSRSEFATGSRDIDHPCEEPPSALFPNRISDNLDSAVHPTAVSDNGSSLCGINVGDQSLPGIVMEQEELSDSEEEVGEHVEFECEEMDDSEGDEGFDSEQIKGLSNCKEAAETVPRKQKISDALSLNLSSLPEKVSKEASAKMTGVEHSTDRNNPSSRPSRSCKKPLSFQKYLTGTKLQEKENRTTLDLLALNPTKGPGKRLCRNNTSSSNMGSSRKGDLDLNSKLKNIAGLKAGKSRKVKSNSDVDVNVVI